MLGERTGDASSLEVHRALKLRTEGPWPAGGLPDFAHCDGARWRGMPPLSCENISDCHSPPHFDLVRCPATANTTFRIPYSQFRVPVIQTGLVANPRLPVSFGRPTRRRSSTSICRFLRISTTTNRQTPRTKRGHSHRCTWTHSGVFCCTDTKRTCRTGREANLGSTGELDEQIKLKRARKSVLAISARVPPEILGRIFVRCLIWETTIPPHLEYCRWLQKGSYNFLLVCHHWFEVASYTPELWSFWGNTLQDWKKRHHRSVTFPLDLVLDESRNRDPEVYFDRSLHCAVRARVVQNAIRQIHIRSDHEETLDSIVSSLTPGNDGDGQNVNIESIIWHHRGTALVDISNFFTQSRLSKLHSLDLAGSLQILSWDPLASQITSLTTLSLHLFQTPSLSTSQLFSILASNPKLQRLSLSDTGIPNDTRRSTLKVRLPRLKLLSLRGEFRQLFGVLRQLTLPAAIHVMDLNICQPTIEDISQTLGSYMQDYFRRDARFQNKLHVSSATSRSSISISIGVIRAQVMPPVRTSPSVSVGVVLPLTGGLEQLLISVVAPIPGDHVASFHLTSGMKLPEEVLAMMPNIETLHLTRAELSKGFLQPNPDGPRADTKLLPSLRSLCLEYVTLTDNDWSHLTKYLVHQTSDNQTISLLVTSASRMDPGVTNEIKDLVEDFTVIATGHPYLR